MAFTDEQNEQIRNDLIREAQRCGITIGMRKTSVEHACEALRESKIAKTVFLTTVFNNGGH